MCIPEILNNPQALSDLQNDNLTDVWIVESDCSQFCISVCARTLGPVQVPWEFTGEIDSCYRFNHATSKSSSINDEGLFESTKDEPWGLIASMSLAEDIKCGFPTMLCASSNFFPDSRSRDIVAFQQDGY
jgi:hypothetical protein